VRPCPLGCVQASSWNRAVPESIVFSAVTSSSGQEASTTIYTYGDDAALDQLWLQCTNGSMLACDDLFNQAPAGSDYETYGDTCGYRTAGGTWCP